MNIYLFDRAKYDRLYNCSVLSPAEWESKKHPNVIIGIANFSIVTVYQLLYFVFLLAMLKRKFWQHSCYKIMFVLGIYDVCATVIGGTISSIFAIRGDIFCTNQSIFLVGCLQAPFWCGCCVSGLILLVNRAVDLIDGRYAHALFGGSKTYVWLLIPICMLLYISFFTTPFMYNAIYDGGFLSPYAGVPEIEVDFSEYDNPLVGNFNYFVAVMYPLMYLVLCVIIWYKTKGGQGKVSSTQKQIVAQSVIVSTLLAIVSAAYIVMQYIETPRFFIVAIQFMWMASHVKNESTIYNQTNYSQRGSRSGIVYLADNQITIMIARKILAFILYLIVGTFALPYFNEELGKQQSFEWLAYAFITVSTIGFGNQFPRGWTSTISTCVYAFFGNPLYNDVTAAVYEKLRDFGQRLYESGMATALINLAYQPVTALHIFQENRRLRGDMEQMQAQFAHDLRMHENENRRLRAQMQAQFAHDLEQMQAQFAHDLEQIQAQLMNEINLLNGKISLYKTMFDLYSRRGQ
ncbi:serpentine type 7TM GPCR chemoreceptor srt domain-containing protein [Ditylenchus destructor]|uniref:Serpentine type 7TM GPCR chemoreceptor srt domain-containing protein n=1 Tax=Ditylenchus destructor TaxID=166010 RepID=A0AAD4N2B1_9BILA|nr:serpentine type 7TM GPCR chemoreceptor srt domain-containing protein [Ditylenchus destructor]